MKMHESFRFDGGTYTGETYNGIPHGHGKIKYNSGDVYEGEFVEGKQHGKGRYTYANGDYYEGDFCRSEFHGFGKQVDGFGTYVGEFRNDKKARHRALRVR